jgi:hypothetical protein
MVICFKRIKRALEMTIRHEFKVGSEGIYQITEAGDPGTCTLDFDMPYGDNWSGYATQGSLKFDACQVDWRDWDTHWPLWISVWGSFEGGVKMIEGITQEERETSIATDGNFRLMFNVDELVPLDMFDYIERECFLGTEN